MDDITRLRALLADVLPHLEAPPKDALDVALRPARRDAERLAQEIRQVLGSFAGQGR